MHRRTKSPVRPRHGRLGGVAGADRDRSAARHRVARIEREVQHRELELAGVELHRPQVGAEVHVDLQVAAQRASQHLAHAAQMLAQVERGRIHRLPARERQQMARQVGAALDGAAHAVERGPARGGVAAQLDQADAVEDHLQQVVEVVRHAAGELAQRLQLLRVPQGVLGLAQPRLLVEPLGDVGHELIGADDGAVAAAQGVEPDLVGAVLAGRVAECGDLQELLAVERTLPPRPHRGLLLRQMRQGVEQALAEPRLDAIDAAQRFGGGALESQPSALRIEHLHDRVGGLDDVGQRLAFGQRLADSVLQRVVGLLQRLLGPELLRRLRDGAEHAGDLAAFIAHGRIGEGEPGLLVVAAPVHQQRQVLAVDRDSRHRRVDQTGDVRPDLRPDA